MIKNIKTVTVVGGGSSGWMSASALIRAFPHWDINIIESPDYPIVGVGESTLLGIREFFHYLGLTPEDEKSMMRYTDASYKMSIKFTDFYDKNSGGFHYPFGTSVAYSGSYYKDWMYKKSLYPDTPVQDFVNTFCPNSYLFENNKYSENLDDQFPGFKPHRDCSYHFDATKLGQWLKKYYCIPRGVTLITDTVVNISTNDCGVDTLLLKSGNTIKSDLYIDCTGFKSLLLSQTLKSEFTSFENILPNNRAWAVHLPYKDKEKELEGFTNSTAIENGWCWNIPLWSRIGTGYVYSDKFISPEEAKEQFKKYLTSDKMLIPRSIEDVESLEYKDISMRVGMHKQSFCKNVVAIGLSAGFIEPLESNGLLSVHYFLFQLIKSLQRESVTQLSRDLYNYDVYHFFHKFAKFICLHYALSVRNDTPYWKEMTSKVFDNTLYDEKTHDEKSFKELSYIRHNTSEFELNSGLTYISVGMNHIPYDDINIKSEEFWLSKQFDEMPEILDQMNKAKEVWKTHAEASDTLYKYLKTNVHY